MLKILSSSPWSIVVSKRHDDCVPLGDPRLSASDPSQIFISSHKDFVDIYHS